MNKVIQEAQVALDNLRRQVIGVYKHHPTSKEYFLILKDNNDGSIHCIAITEFGAVHHFLNYPVGTGVVKYFDNGRNMMDLLNEEPLKWRSFIESINYSSSIEETIG